MLLSIALDHLTLARAELYQAILGHSAFPIPPSEIQAALSGLRAANMLNHLPKALLTAAMAEARNAELGAREKDQAAVISAFRALRSALDEAEEIARRGPMPLFLADVHLHRARIFRDRAELKKARKLIVNHGYGRRTEELEDAEAAAAGWPPED